MGIRQQVSLSGSMGRWLKQAHPLKGAFWTGPKRPQWAATGRQMAVDGPSSDLMEIDGRDRVRAPPSPGFSEFPQQPRIQLVL